jgi:DNA repair protein RadC
MSDQNRRSIKEWAEDDRPREKLVKKGTDVLSNAELIAILIGTGTRNQSAVELSRKLLELAGDNLNELAKLTLKDFQKIKGIGQAKAVTIITALELGKRRKISEVVKRKKIVSSHDIFDIFGSLLGDLPYEEFWILLLNRSNFIIDRLKISRGGISGTVTDIRIILKLAIEKMASSLILCHNHPSGNLKPSEPDVNLTSKLKEAGTIMGIGVLDHVIVSDNSYFSFADEGMM